MAVRYWISESDALIRRTAFDFDFSTAWHAFIRAGRAAQGNPMMPLVVSYTIDHHVQQPKAKTPR